MEKKYKGSFGELLKLIEYGAVKETHPYYNIYKYIIETNKENIRRKNIQKYTKKIIEELKEQIKKQFYNNCGIINLEMQPYLIAQYSVVFNEYEHQLNKISELENESKFKELLEDIYNEFQNSINENKKLIDENNQKNYKAIIEECILQLDGIKYKGKYLIEEMQDNNQTKQTINNEAIKELIGKLEEKDLKAFILLEQFERKKFILIEKSLNLYKQIENHKDIVYNYLINKINENIEIRIIEAFKTLQQDKKTFRKLQIENIITIHNGKTTVSITQERLRELDITGEIFEILNKISRLQDIKTKLEEKINDKQQYEDISNIIENIDFEMTEPRFFEFELERACKQYRYKKIEQANEIIKAYSNIQQTEDIYKTQTIIKLEQESQTNISKLYMPSTPGMPTPRNALYIAKILIEIKENTDDFQNFLQEKEVTKLSLTEENMMIRIIKEKINKYINDEDYKDNKKLKKEKNNGY